VYKLECAYEEGVAEGDSDVGADHHTEVARDDAREAGLAAQLLRTELELQSYIKSRSTRALEAVKMFLTCVS
jgi:hypothetical protein